MPETERPRAVLDTNMLVSATLFPSSIPAQTLRIIRLDYTLLASHSTLDELTDVISRDKFDKYVSYSERSAVIKQLMRECHVVAVEDLVHACRDPRDDKFLSLAVAGGAGLLITGDRDLLVLHPFQEIEILTPAAFLARQGTLRR